MGIFSVPVLPRRRGLLWSAVLFALFALLVVPFYSTMPAVAGLSALVPVMTAAWTLGWMGGAAAGVLAVTLIVVVGMASGTIEAGALAAPNVLVRSGAIVVMGAGVGRLRELLTQSVNALEASQRDIAARKEAEAAAREAEAKYRILVEHSLAGVYIIQDDRFVYANPKLCEIYGYTRAELLALPTYLEIAAEEERPRVAESVRRRLGGVEESAHYMVRARRKDGEPIHLEIHAGRMDYQGRPAVIGTVLDVTERRSMEERLLRAQRLESIGQLAGGVAHNFNNALTAIFGYSELALHHLGAEHPAHADIERIQRVAEQSAAMTRQLLAFSRRQTVESTRFDLNDAVQAGEALFRPLVGEHVRLVVRLRPGIGLVNADRGQIEQVITNLVLNARDAMPDGGTVTVDTASLGVDADFARAHPEAHVGRYARLTVTDTGVGMDEATRARIFDPFFTTKAPGRGVGLGLAMVHGAVTQSGGFITVGSRPGQGTSFAVYLPCAPEEEPAPEGGGPRAGDAGDGRPL